MATVKLATPLRHYTNKQKAVTVDGATVGEVLANLLRQYPDLREELYQEGQLRASVSLFIGREDVQNLGGLDTPVDETVTVRIILPIAGG